MSLSVEKQWDDFNNLEGLRPKEIIVSLIANKDFNNPVIRQVIKADEYGQWKHTFKNLPKYLNDRSINYEIIEDFVMGYRSQISKVNDEAIVLTNSRDTELISLAVFKRWNDNNNQAALRPDYIEVSLYANDDLLETRIITKEENWKTEFEDLLKYKDGKEIKYHIVEKEVVGYQGVVEVINDDEIWITNTLIPNEPETPDDPEVPTNPEEPKTPKTGLSNNYQIWIMILIVMGYSLIRLKKQKRV